MGNTMTMMTCRYLFIPPKLWPSSVAVCHRCVAVTPSDIVPSPVSVGRRLKTVVQAGLSPKASGLGDSKNVVAAAS